MYIYIYMYMYICTYSSDSTPRLISFQFDDSVQLASSIQCDLPYPTLFQCDGLIEFDDSIHCGGDDGRDLLVCQQTCPY